MHINNRVGWTSKSCIRIISYGISCRSEKINDGDQEMSEMIMKLRENEKVCRFCDIVEGLFLVTFPLVLPALIMWGASTW
jgi:hypothetical protein